MLEWLRETFSNGQEVHFDKLAGRLCLAFLLGLAVAAIYSFTQRHSALPARAGNGDEDRPGLSLVSTLVLLSVLIAMVTQVIGNNLARAFGLVGALSIVRFRTVVEDTRDTAFVIFAVIVGMAVGAGQPEVALAGIPIAGIAAFLTRPRRPSIPEFTPFWTLSVRLSVGHSADKPLADLFGEHLEETHLMASATGRQGAALDLTYRVRLRATSTPTALVAALNRLEGVQNVELRR